MRRKPLILLGIATLLVSLAVFLLLGHDHEPVCQGQPLRVWMARYAEANQVNPASADTASAATALRTMREDAMPFLLQWIRCERKPQHAKAQAFLDALPYSRRLPFGTRHAEERAFGAERAFLALGPQASNAVPALLQLLADTNAPDTALRATAALNHIGEPALLPLLGVIANPQSPNRDYAVYALSTMTQVGKHADQALPILLKCLDDQAPGIAQHAALALGNLDVDPSAVVPALTKSLTNADSSLRERAAYSLSKYKEGAKSSVPHLLALLRDTNAQVRTAAVFALTNIAPEVLTNTPAQ
jgi:hypothetical protein